MRYLVPFLPRGCGALFVLGKITWPLCAVLLGSSRFATGAEPPLKLLTATFWGTAEEDDVQGAAQAPDGTIYLVGNVGAGMNDLPGGVRPTLFGQAAAAPKCGRAFVAHFSGDLKALLHYAELAEGVALFTTVQSGKPGVYVGGYAAAGL
jgi:hypothetical protein